MRLGSKCFLFLMNITRLFIGSHDEISSSLQVRPPPPGRPRRARRRLRPVDDEAARLHVRAPAIGTVHYDGGKDGNLNLFEIRFWRETVKWFFPGGEHDVHRSDARGLIISFWSREAVDNVPERGVQLAAGEGDL